MIVIIGGGVWGLTMGWRLQQGGHPVTLLEMAQVGHGASWAAAGMLMPWKISATFGEDLLALQRESHARWPDFAAELEAAAGLPIEFVQDGRFFVATSPRTAERLQQQYAYHQKLGLAVTWLNAEAALAREPQLNPKLKAVVYTPMAAQVDNRQLVAALKTAFVRSGGNLRENTPVRRLHVVAGQVRGVEIDGDQVTARAVILAAGAWSAQFAGGPADEENWVGPFKGQNLVLQMPPNEPLIRQTIIGPGYLVPRHDGRLIAGTTYEGKAGFDLSVTDQGRQQILDQVARMVPAVRTLPIIDQHAGLRPSSPTRRPIIGPGTLPGLFIASGGHSSGILLTPLIGEVGRYWIETGALTDLLRPFVPRSVSAAG